MAGLLLLGLAIVGAVVAATAALMGYWWLLEPKPVGLARGFEVLPTAGKSMSQPKEERE